MRKPIVSDLAAGSPAGRTAKAEIESADVRQTRQMNKLVVPAGLCGFDKAIGPQSYPHPGLSQSGYRRLFLTLGSRPICHEENSRNYCKPNRNDLHNCLVD